MSHADDWLPHIDHAAGGEREKGSSGARAGRLGAVRRARGPDDDVTKTGLLGGSFDPIHNGHISVAQQTADRLGFEKVLVIPAGAPPHKDPASLAPARDRLMMARLACRNMRRLEVSDIEAKKGGPCYTIDTVRELKRVYGPETELYLIIGEDSLGELPTWKDAGRLVESTEFAIVFRPRWPRADFEKLAAELGSAAAVKLRQSVVKIGHPADVSSTEIRRRLARGESIAGLVRAEVEDYIRERGLYRK